MPTPNERSFLPAMNDSTSFQETPYYRFNREERNYAAILYHLLLSGQHNLKAFLNLIEHRSERSIEQCDVYYEFALQRDAWHQMDDAAKRDWLLLKLPLGLDPPSHEEGWNTFFGLTRNPSRTVYQSPASWVLSRIDDSVQGQQYRDLAMLKWCFNIKPDLVIITGRKQAVCIEAKVESGQGKYPTSSIDKAEWKRRVAGSYVDQLDCQRHLFHHVLEFPIEAVTYILLDEKGAGAGEAKGLSWKSAFAAMETAPSHPFVENWLRDRNWK
ncbi:MAG: hypothetical protein IPM12_14860 [Flavobacteriales bacterium]|nr:hypothetical protein [Flavobacteriales bacterium]